MWSNIVFWTVFLPFCHCTHGQNDVSAYLASLQAHPRARPLYPVHYTDAWDGQLTSRNDINQMRMHYKLMGLNNLNDIVQRGKMIVNYFNDEFGSDFPTDESAILNTNGTTCCGGAITMIPIVNNVANFYRVISFANFKEGVKMNNAISTAGWNLNFNSDYEATGKLNRLIPANSRGLWHDNVIRIGKNAEFYSKKEDTSFPGPLFAWTVLGAPVILPPSQYDGSVSINCKLQHNDLGEGQLTGLLVPEEEDPSKVNSDTIFHGREVGTWPKALPASLPSVH